MKENDIRPSNLMAREKKLNERAVSRILKQKDEFVNIPCPSCQSKNYKFLFKKNHFSFVSCSLCETMFINPRPTFSMLSEHYLTSLKYWNKKIFPQSEDSRRKQIFVPRAKKVVELCKAYKAKTEILLDVGAGFGTFCEEIKKLSVFKDVIAVEPSHDLAETCRKKRINVIELPIEEVNLNRVSVITNFELIEHLFWPKDFLLACAKILPRGGLFIATTPNIKGFDLLTLAKISDNIGGPNHLNYFHAESLSYLLEQCGFKVIESLTPGKLDAEIVRKKIISGLFDVSHNSFLEYILINTWEENGKNFQKYLADSKLSSHMWVVAKKR